MKKRLIFFLKTLATDKKNLEIVVISLFMILNLFVLGLKPYLLLIVISWIILVSINHDLLKSTWIMFLASLLFARAKFFPQDMTMLNLPEDLFEIEQRGVIFNYFVSFSDALLVLLLILGKRLSKNKNQINPPIKILLIIFTGIIFTSAFYSPYPYQAFFFSLQMLKYLLIFFLTSKISRSKQILEATLYTLIIFLLINNILIFIQKASGSTIGLLTEINPWSIFGRFADENFGLFRPGGFTADPNLIASIYATLIPFFLILNKKNINKKLYSTTILTSFIALIITASRAAIIITSVHSIIILAFFYKKNIKITNHVRIFLVICLLFTPLLISRFSTLKSTIFGSGGLYRLRHLIMAKNYLLENRWGIGLNIFQFKILKDYEPAYYFYDSAPPHNIFAQLAASTGILGLTNFILIIIYLLRNKIKSSKLSLISLASTHGMIAFLIIANFYPWLLKSPISDIFWIISGIGIYNEA